MCGICGIVKSNNPIADKDKDIITRMKETLLHRGPDGEGTIGGEQFIFGHRRLAIIDPEHNIQPMQTEDGALTLTYNGEIYNYVELRQELSRKGVQFKTFSDTEVLLKLLEIEGIDGINKLNGMFAFALFDNRTGTFTAARDHLGIKPFYYVKLKTGDLIFASEIKALLQHPQVHSSLNKAAFQEYLTFQFCLSGKTLFEGINSLEPGHLMIRQIHDNSDYRIKKYWDLHYEIDHHKTSEYFSETLFSLLQDSVTIQLRSDVPVGAHLSGGLDSSAVATIASSIYRNNFKCFTGKFNESPLYDESHYARLVAKSIDCPIEEIVPTSSDFVEYLPKLIYYMDEPAAGPGLFPQYMVSRLAAQKVKVVLGGQGGDEIFCGYARYLIGYLEQALKGSIFETQEEGKHLVTLSSIVPNLPVLQQYTPLMQHFWKDGLFEDMGLRYFRLIDRSPDIASILTDDALEEFNKEAVYAEFEKVFNHPETISYINKMVHFDTKSFLPSLLQVEDRVSMAVSLESRVPLLDTRIVNLLNSTPPNIKFHGGKTKHILKTAVKHIIPEKVLNRKDKMGFPVPLKEWMSKGEVRDFIRDILLSKTLKERGIFNVVTLEKLMNEEAAFGRQLWGALCIELWYKTFIDH